MSHLEQAIAEPKATPGRIVEVVSGLRSDTVDAPRNLSSSLVSRLEEIADHHDGLVPLHGRLFAQWMHHAYPLECPYPHAAGTSSPLTPDEWMDSFGANQIEAPREDRTHFIKQKEVAKQSETLPWTHVEELVVAHKSKPTKPRVSSMLRKGFAFLAVVALAIPIARAPSLFLSMSSSAQPEKCHLV